MKYSLIQVDREYDGMVDGVWMQNHIGTIDSAAEVARATERANSNRITVAVVEDLGYSEPNYSFRTALKRLDIAQNLNINSNKKEVVLFASLLPESIGSEIDSHFKKNGWALLACNTGEAKGYQVFFGTGVQVDNLYEYGFPYLYDKEELLAFAKDFYTKKIIQVVESIHDAETFSFLGYNEFAERLSQFFEEDNRFFDYAWAVSKPHENDSIKKDYIAYWDQGNGWCNVFGVFEGITQEQFVNELKNIQQQNEQEKPKLNNLIESASVHANKSQFAPDLNNKIQEPER